jgi:hypothetical protein
MKPMQLPPDGFHEWPHNAVSWKSLCAKKKMENTGPRLTGNGLRGALIRLKTKGLSHLFPEWDRVRVKDGHSAFFMRFPT